MAVELTAGQAGDAPVFGRLLGAVPADVPVGHGVADTA